jgi:hypothetical protein
MGHDEKAPAGKLLRLGDPSRSIWPDYPSLGLGPAEVPELIRLACDEKLLDAPEGDDSWWIPIHARRALGQLRVAVAVEPLLSLLPRIDARDDDWVNEDLPKIMGLIGEPGIAPLAAFVADSTQNVWGRICAAEAIRHIGSGSKAVKQRCVEILAGQLEHFAENKPELNGTLIAELVELAAREHAGLIEKVFRSGRADEEGMGTWEDIRAELGLAPPRGNRPRVDAIEAAIDSVLPPPEPETPQWMKGLL